MIGRITSAIYWNLLCLYRINLAVSGYHLNCVRCSRTKCMGYYCSMGFPKSDLNCRLCTSCHPIRFVDDCSCCQCYAIAMQVSVWQSEHNKRIGWLSCSAGIQSPRYISTWQMAFIYYTNFYRLGTDLLASTTLDKCLRKIRELGAIFTIDIAYNCLIFPLGKSFWDDSSCCVCVCVCARFNRQLLVHVWKLALD